MTGHVERLFVAVWPPEDVVEQLRTIRRKDRSGVRFLAPETWHITLRFLGDAHVDDAIDALDGFDLPAREARVGPGVDILSGRALVLPVRGVDDLAAEVAQRTAAIGERPERNFVGHLTIARLKSSRTPMPSALGTYIDMSFDVDEIALVSSTLRPEGARYTTLETWPLTRGDVSGARAPARE